MRINNFSLIFQNPKICTTLPNEIKLFHDIASVDMDDYSEEFGRIREKLMPRMPFCEMSNQEEFSAKIKCAANMFDVNGFRFDKILSADQIIFDREKKDTHLAKVVKGKRYDVAQRFLSGQPPRKRMDSCKSEFVKSDGPVFKPKVEEKLLADYLTNDPANCGTVCEAISRVEFNDEQSYIEAWACNQSNNTLSFKQSHRNEPSLLRNVNGFTLTGHDGLIDQVPGELSYGQKSPCNEHAVTSSLSCDTTSSKQDIRSSNDECLELKDNLSEYRQVLNPQTSLCKEVSSKDKVAPDMDLSSEGELINWLISEKCHSLDNIMKTEDQKSKSLGIGIENEGITLDKENELEIKIIDPPSHVISVKEADEIRGIDKEAASLKISIPMNMIKLRKREAGTKMKKSTSHDNNQECNRLKEPSFDFKQQQPLKISIPLLKVRMNKLQRDKRDNSELQEQKSNQVTKLQLAKSVGCRQPPLKITLVKLSPDVWAVKQRACPSVTTPCMEGSVRQGALSVMDENAVRRMQTLNRVKQALVKDQSTIKVMKNPPKCTRRLRALKRKASTLCAMKSRIIGRC